MRTHFLTIIFLFCLFPKAWAQVKIRLSQVENEIIEKETKLFTQLSSGKLNDVFKGEVISTSDVSSPNEKEQILGLFVVGIHPRSCKRAMRKLSLYENYHSYVDFIKMSSYDEAAQKIFFLIDHALLPFSMSLKFKIPRIKNEGHYPFIFEEGFLKDLKGTIIVKKVNHHCLLGLKADWRGPETVIPNLVFETFLETVGKIGLEHLIRVSIF